MDALPDSVDENATFARLFARTNAGIKPGTEAITALLAELGDPQETFLCVHVAGTNGKGSVSAILDSILRAAGLKTGLYTSPHLVNFNERFRFQGRAISNSFLEELIGKVEAADERAAKRERPGTFFEMSTAIAFQAFAEYQVQVAIIETGLGGKWDATNVIHPLVSVITPISHDHTEYLGATLSEIAAEKAGIIKEGRPVIVAAQDPIALDVLRGKSEELQAPMILVEEVASIGSSHVSLEGQKFQVETAQQNYGTCHLPLLGAHQLQNASQAVVAAEQIFQALGLELEVEAVKKGLKQVQWSGRCQVLSADPPVLLDGAHNPAGAASLAATLDALFPGQQGAFVFGFLNDKDPEGILEILGDSVGRGFATQSNSPRSLSAEDVRKQLKSCNIAAELGSLDQARQWARDNQTYVCVTGSLYLIGEILAGHPEA